ncbi:hypothetical protein EZH22_05705 [Xanthobacter dioxanivorans]|uniref:Uncharacterized protein n=1 Tax=Xanthobacter dioxanivorans TaxID=2528964 RepID=A0A974SKU1_9HYPH|nr:hypothetical protein [Xanthobacter dioxanivorans]QRG07868.1 hypothetical protein EZH22_05705 [Xanthobacter dioxanivorans]
MHTASKLTIILGALVFVLMGVEMSPADPVLMQGQDAAALAQTNGAAGVQASLPAPASVLIAPQA